MTVGTHWEPFAVPTVANVTTDPFSWQEMDDEIDNF